MEALGAQHLWIQNYSLLKIRGGHLRKVLVYLRGNQRVQEVVLK